MPLPMPDQAVIVLLTVNEHETHAVLDAFLDGGQEAGLQTRGGLSYLALGLHGGNRIIHSSCEMGTGSVGAAQQRTRDAIDHWQPCAVIAVGIAFGLDQGKQNIGDVLVAKQIQDYELGRLESDGKFTPRGSRVDCADNLCNRLRQMNLLESRRADDWPKLHWVPG